MRKKIFIGFSILFLATMLAVRVSTQDAVKAVPDMHKVLLENEHVRVYEVSAKAGQKMPMHSHPDHVVYFLTPGKAHFVSSDGKMTDLEFKKGQAIWANAVTHTWDNTGSGDFSAVVIELKSSMTK